MDMRAVPPLASGDASPVTRDDLDGIAVLTLDRPQSRNTLSEAMLNALSRTVAGLSGDASVRAVVLAANGPAFSAGHDLKELTAHRRDDDGGRAYTRRIMESCSALMQALMQMPQPVIAAVEGIATAAGCQLVATCDLAVASRAAQFCTPGVSIGLFCSTPMVPLSRNLSPKHAMDMLLTGDAIGADQALAMGLINRLVEPGFARDEAVLLARRIAIRSPLALATGKKIFYRQLNMSVADAYRLATDTMVDNMMAADAKEGIGAFIDKRPPVWEGR